MARQFGYGGLANTNGIRSFSGKVEAAAGFGKLVTVDEFDRIVEVLGGFTLLITNFWRN